LLHHLFWLLHDDDDPTKNNWVSFASAETYWRKRQKESLYYYIGSFLPPRRIIAALPWPAIAIILRLLFLLSTSHLIIRITLKKKYLEEEKDYDDYLLRGRIM